MSNSSDYEKILLHKEESVNILSNKIKEIEDNSWTQVSDSIRRKTGREPKVELSTYGESLLFEFTSFLDILIRYMNGEDIESSDSYFKEDNINSLEPKDEFVNSLQDYYKNGVSNQKYSISKIKGYRNKVTHATMLDLSKTFKWESGDGFPSLEENKFILPDDPEIAFEDYTYNQKIALFGMVEEIEKIMDNIWSFLEAEDRFNKYSG